MLPQPERNDKRTTLYNSNLYSFVSAFTFLFVNLHAELSGTFVHIPAGSIESTSLCSILPRQK